MLLLLRDKEGGDAQRETNISQSIGGEHIVQAFQFSLGHVTHKKKKKTTQSCHPCSTKHMSPLGFKFRLTAAAREGSSDPPAAT